MDSNKGSSEGEEVEELLLQTDLHSVVRTAKSRYLN